MATEPAVALPPDDDRRHAFMGAIITLTIIAVLITWLRMYTRVFISRNTWWDDWIMFIASFLIILANGILTRAFYLGLGRHIYYVPKEQIPDCFKWLWASEPTNLFALYTVRVSVALFFLRLIPSHQKLYRSIAWATIIGLTIADIYVTVNYFIQCRPIQKVWRSDLPGKCLSDGLYAAAPWLYQAVSIITDLALVSIPILMLRDLQVPNATKFGIMALCGLGLFTCIIAITKTALLPALFDHKNMDKTWSLAQLCFWAAAEICVGMICGSLPCLKPLYHYTKNGRKLQSNMSSSYGSNLAHGASETRSRRKNYGYNITETYPEQSKSEELIIPRELSEDDLELGKLNRHKSDKKSKVKPSEAPVMPVIGSGILRTTQVEFRTYSEHDR